jgi:hypothetical protein
MPAFQRNNNGKPWTEQNVAELLQLIGDKVPLHIIRLQIGRSQAAIDGRMQIIRGRQKKNAEESN